MRLTVAAVLSLAISVPAAMPAIGADGVPLGCAVTRARDLPGLEAGYSVVVKNTGTVTLPAGTSIAIKVTLAGGMSEERSAKLASALVAGGRVTLLSEKYLGAPRTACVAEALKGRPPGFATPSPTPVPAATCHPGDGSGAGCGSASPCVTGGGSGQRANAGCSPTPVPVATPVTVATPGPTTSLTPAPVATPTCPPQVRPGGGCTPSSQ